MNIVLDTIFVDCAFKANARYIVTEGHHYEILKQTAATRESSAPDACHRVGDGDGG